MLYTQVIDLIEIYEQSIPPNPSALLVEWVHNDSYASLKASAVDSPPRTLFFEAQKPLIREDDCVKLFAITLVSR